MDKKELASKYADLERHEIGSIVAEASKKMEPYLLQQKEILIEIAEEIILNHAKNQELVSVNSLVKDVKEEFRPHGMMGKIDAEGLRNQIKTYLKINFGFTHHKNENKGKMGSFKRYFRKYNIYGGDKDLPFMLLRLEGDERPFNEDNI